MKNESDPAASLDPINDPVVNVDLESERIVLLGAMLEREIAGRLDPSLFSGHMRTVARCALRLHQEGEPITIAALRGQLHEDHRHLLRPLEAQSDDVRFFARLTRPRIDEALAALERLARLRDADRLAREATAAIREGRVDDAHELLAVATRRIDPPSRSRVKPLEPLAAWGEDPLASKPPDPRWLVRRRTSDDDTSIGFLERGIVGGLVGRGGVGKSSLVAQLLLGVATGDPFVGPLYVPEPGHVLYACTEETRDTLQRRLHFAARAMRLDATARAIAAQRVVPLVLHGEAPALLERSRTGGVTETRFATELFERAAAVGCEWRLVVFDTLSRFGPSEVEVENGIAAAFIAHLERYTRLLGNPAVLYVHHIRKNGGSDVEDVRGAAALTDNARWIATMRATEDVDGAIVSVRKHNNTPPQRDLYLARDPDLETSLREMTAEEIAIVDGRGRAA